jgi:hypothetical protein
VINWFKTHWLKLLVVDAGRWQLLYFCGLAMLPAFITSLILPYVLVPFGAGLSAVAAYYIFKGDIQKELFSLSAQEAYFFLNIPFYAFCLAWAGLLIWIGNGEQVYRCVGPVFLLIVVCIWPVYRLKNSRIERRVPFAHIYPVFAGVMLTHQLLIMAAEVISWFAV